MKYGRGYIPDSQGKRLLSKSSRKLFGGASPSTVVPAASLEAFEYAILDQNATSSCTGHGSAQALYISAMAAGRPLPFCPSPRAIYSTVRMLELASASDALTDSGAMPTDIITVVNRWGVSAMQAPTPDGHNSDVWIGNVNDKMDLLALEQTFVNLQVAPTRVDETAADFTAQLQLSIANKVAGGVGIFVDTAFEDWNGSTPITGIDTSDPNGGGHWLAVSYYYTLPTGVVVFGGPNSWASQWGINGHWEIAAPCLQSVCSDCLVFPVS